MTASRRVAIVMQLKVVGPARRREAPAFPLTPFRRPLGGLRPHLLLTAAVSGPSVDSSPNQTCMRWRA